MPDRRGEERIKQRSGQPFSSADDGGPFAAGEAMDAALGLGNAGDGRAGGRVYGEGGEELGVAEGKPADHRSFERRKRARKWIETKGRAPSVAAASGRRDSASSVVGGKRTKGQRIIGRGGKRTKGRAPSVAAASG